MRRVKLKFSPLHSSLVNLPLSVYGPLVSTGVRPQAVSVHLSNLLKGPGHKSAYLGWTGLASASSTARWGSKGGDESLDTVEVDPQLSASLGFNEGDVLELGLVHNLPIAKSVSTEPLTPDDWEILELHAQYVEDNLLSQVRVAALDQHILVWIMGKNLIRFRVSSMDPAKGPCLLSTDTELIIAPNQRKPLSLPKESIESNGAARASGLIARVVPVDNYPIDVSAYSPLCALVPPSTLGILGLKEGQQVYIQRQSPPISDLTKEIKHYQDFSNSTGKKSARIKLKDRITTTSLNEAEEESKPQPSTYSIFAAELLPRNHMILLGCPDIRSWDLARVSVKPPETNTGEPLSQELKIPFLLPSTMKNPKFVGVDSVLSECTQFFQHSLLAKKTLGGSNTSQMLLCGGRGSGKTGVATTVAARLEQDAQLCICPLYVDMSRYSEEPLTGVRALFNLLIRLAIWCKPAILILDNLHYFVGVETEHTESSKSTRIAELFVKFLYDLKSHSASVLATAEGTSSLNKVVSTGHTFSKVMNIKTPDKNARATILKRFVEGAEVLPTRGLNYISLATKTEGYSAQDLKDFTDRALHKATIRTADANAQRVSVEMCDFEAAQEGFTPLSLRDVKLQKSEVEWADIGGLHETRRVLRETLEWPTKYAAIFAKCPLRLRSGLLLYGYPGCGKTLLASAVSKECGLNFISVKGPELLNKYIGASEKSVRELFERASAAKPCVLFFDEFDSIAPRRGHDSTGVTDRVVNQMLTQMDGAEGLDGVYVLAATSRPDLIDPALLRPGRLDKSLLCHMPTEPERKEILQAIARKMHVDSGVDFDHIAASTEGYSGADLQALVYNAHLESVHDAFSGSTPIDIAETKTPEFVVLNGAKGVSKAETSAITARIATVIRSSNPIKAAAARAEAKPPTITVRHMRKALSTTRPSVPEVERRRLERIYHEFSSDRSEALPLPPEADSRSVGNRVSLM